MPDIIQIRDLHHNYEQKSALAAIDITVPQGELHGLIGPDSAGKTT